MNLRLRWRTALVVAVVTTVALGALLVFDRFVLVSGFQEFEDSEIRRDAARVIHAVDAEGGRMKVMISDWAAWDDSYSFMQTRSPAFVASNLSASILEDLDLAAMVFLDTHGAIVEVRSTRSDGSAGLIDELTPGHGMSKVREIIEVAPDEKRRCAVIRTESGVPLLIVARPITRSDGTGVPRGTLVFARWFDDERIEGLSGVLATPVEFLQPVDAPPGLIGLTAESDALLVVRESGAEPVGYGVIRDISGQPAIVVRTSQERAVSALAAQTTVTLVGTVLLLGTGVAGAIILALQFTVLRPMGRLQREMATIEGGPMDARVTVVGSDEIADMARDVNRMLDRLAAAAEEHERLQGAVSEQRDLAATALDAMSEGLLAFDMQGFCIVCNPAAARLLRTSEHRARGRHLTELLPGVQTAPLHPSGPQLIEVEGRTLAVSRDPGGPPSARRYSVMVIRDVTDILDVERLRRDVISTVSHELRTPLTAIQATVEMLDGTDAGPRNEVQGNLLSLLSRNVARLRHILDDLLTLSALEGASVRIDRDRLDLGVLAARVIEDLRPTAIAAGVQLTAESRGDVVAWVDEARMRQVFENLIQNAIKFSRPESAVLVVTSREAGMIRIAVTDHGPGIPRGELVRVFDRFYRSPSAPRNAQGTGLGLTIARMIVELHGGRIWLESDGRSGTSAYVTLPTQQPIPGP